MRQQRFAIVTLRLSQDPVGLSLVRLERAEQILVG
jgi:hypothetical protein